MKTKVFLCLIYLFILSPCFADNNSNKNVINISIKNQEDFDNIFDYVNKQLDSISTYKNSIINVNIYSGIYRFKKSRKFKYTKSLPVEIYIKAIEKDKVVIISDGDTFTNQLAVSTTPSHYICNIEDYNHSYTFIDQDFNYIKTQNSSNISPKQINLAEEKPLFINKKWDSKTKRLLSCDIKLKIPYNLKKYISNKDKLFFKNSILYFTAQWFDYNANDIFTDSEYIYASCILNGQNPNAIERDCVDEKYNLPTRFYITNISTINIQKNQILVSENKIYIPHSIKKLYMLKNPSLWFFENLSFNKISISGIKFMGSSYTRKEEYLINVNNCNNFYCDNNIFSNINSKAPIGIKAKTKTPYYPNKSKEVGQQEFYITNTQISNNKFTNIGCAVCVIGRSTKNSRFINNQIFNSGILMANYCLMASGKNLQIRNNQFINVPFNDIYILPQGYLSCNIEYNEFYNTDEYNKNYEAHSLIDGGIIYSGWHSDGTIIRHNIFHDKKGYSNYRGIMVDSGGYNHTIYGNLLYRLGSTFYIDIRQSNDGNNPNLKIRDNNTNNKLYNNIILGPYRIMGNPQSTKNVCIGSNLYNYMNNNKQNILTNSNINSEQILINNISIVNNILYINTKIPFKLSSFVKDRIKP